MRPNQKKTLRENVSSYLIAPLFIVLQAYTDGVVVLTDDFCPTLPMSLGSEPFPGNPLPQFSVFKGLQTL